MGKLDQAWIDYDSEVVISKQFLNLHLNNKCIQKDFILDVLSMIEYDPGLNNKMDVIDFIKDKIKQNEIAIKLKW